LTYPLLDTDIIVRFLTGDDPAKQRAARALFDDVMNGIIKLIVPVTVIADAVFVLASPRLYKLPRSEIAAMLGALVRLTNLRVHHRRAVLRALELYGDHNIDFGDALILAMMDLAGSTVVYSYDRDFERFPGIQRREP
jgi:predicted nucleic acid-binding protein